MQVTLQFDTADLFRPSVQLGIDAYLRGELNARELCDLVGWRGDDFNSHFAGIFLLACSDGPSKLIVPPHSELQRLYDPSPAAAFHRLPKGRTNGNQSDQRTREPACPRRKANTGGAKAGAR